MSDARLRDLERRWRSSQSTAARDAYLAEWRRHQRDAVWLVYRTPYEGPGCKRVVELKADSILGWFQQGWRAAARWDTEDDGELYERAAEWERGQTRGGVYGLASIFHAARTEELPIPADWGQLTELLAQHLYVEGMPPSMEDGLTIRVLTDDDEIALSYYFLTSSYAAAYPERAAFLLHEPWRLPRAAATRAAFTDQLELPEVDPAGDGPGATYVVDFSIRDGNYLDDLADDAAAMVLPGVRVPDLPNYLRDAEAGDWPPVLQGLRVALGRRERTLRQAVARCGEHGTDTLAEVGSATTYDEVRRALGAAWPTIQAQAQRPVRPSIHHPPGRGVKPDSSHAQAAPHLLQLSRWSDWKHDAWYVFDDLWATAHPHLAQSLLRYAVHWDPLRD